MIQVIFWQVHGSGTISLQGSPKLLYLQLRGVFQEPNVKQPNLVGIRLCPVGKLLVQGTLMHIALICTIMIWLAAAQVIEADFKSLGSHLLILHIDLYFV